MNSGKPRVESAVTSSIRRLFHEAKFCTRASFWKVKTKNKINNLLEYLCYLQAVALACKQVLNFTLSREQRSMVNEHVRKTSPTSSSNC